MSPCAESKSSEKEFADSRSENLAVPTVRRSCPENCVSCKNHESDMCYTGHYFEHGIKGLNGFAGEFAKSDSTYIVKMPESMSEMGVLLEPLTVVEKGIVQTYSLQKTRLIWKPERALVLGAGPVGILATALLRLMGLEVDTVATRSKDSLKARLVESTGANYLNSKETPLSSLDYKYDLVFEITGNPGVAYSSQDSDSSQRDCLFPWYLPRRSGDSKRRQSLYRTCLGEQTSLRFSQCQHFILSERSPRSCKDQQEMAQFTPQYDNKESRTRRPAKNLQSRKRGRDKIGR